MASLQVYGNALSRMALSARDILKELRTSLTHIQVVIPAHLQNTELIDCDTGKDKKLIGSQGAQLQKTTNYNIHIIANMNSRKYMTN